jgi:hypothetical protein
MDIFGSLDESARNQLLLLWDLDDKLANEIIHKLVYHWPVNPSAYVVSCVKHARHRVICPQARCSILNLFCVSLLGLGETAADLTNMAAGTVIEQNNCFCLFLRCLVSFDHTCSFVFNANNKPCSVLNVCVYACVRVCMLACLSCVLNMLHYLLSLLTFVESHHVTS